jgi:hypothetical protein
MENRKESSHISTNIISTFFYDKEVLTPTFVNKEVSCCLIMDTIKQSIIDQHKFTFRENPYPKTLEMLVDGFVLFNLHKNRYMLENKNSLIKYLNDNTISLEEKMYFTDIFLYNQRPNFLTFDEHEYFRAGGYEDFA